MNWDDYRFALALHRAGSVRGAAEALGVNHATVSRRLATLNARTGWMAFERQDGGYVPTRQGRGLIDAALRMEEAVFAAERAAMAQEHTMEGSLALSLPDVFADYLLIDEIDRFSAAFPDVVLSVFTSMSFADLDRRESDVVVRVSNDPPEHLVGRRLFKYARCCYCTDDYLATHDVADVCWLGWPGDADHPDWVRGTVFPDAPVRLRVEDPTVRHRAAVAGLGMVLESCFMGDQDRRLVRLPGARVEPDRDIWVLTHPDLKDTPRVSALLRALVRALTAKRALIEGRGVAASFQRYEADHY